MNRIAPRERFYVVLALCSGFVLRLFILTTITAIENDGTAYATIADQFARGLFGQALNNVFSPTYPLFIALFHLVVPDIELAARLVSLIFGTLLIYLSFLLARRVLHDDTKAVWAAFLVAFHPLLVRYSGQAVSESLAAFLLTSTVMFFYVGRQEDRRIPVAVSGMCLVLTYLARPEYIVFYAPFVLLLGLRRRMTDVIIFLSPFLVLGVLYVSYLHMETGLWIVSKKETLSPFVDIGAFFVNIPFVLYEFFIAVSPFFFGLAILGYRRVEGTYRGLFVLLALVHILSLSFISHATKRYSVEFAPLVIMFASAGMIVFNEYLGRFVRKRLVTLVVALVVILVGIWQSYTPPDYAKALQKKAGLFVLHHDPGSVIAARYPTASFYAKGRFVNLSSELAADPNSSHLERIISEKGVKYLIVDENTVSELPFLREYLARKTPLQESHHENSFVQVYRVDRTVTNN